MKQYQLFILNLEGRVRTRYNLIGADDDDVKRRAEKFFGLCSRGMGRAAPRHSHSIEDAEPATLA